jgi:transposase-like protein
MSALECPACGSANVININLTVDRGPISFYSCHQCDKRWWNDQDGLPIDLPNVLDMARKPARTAKPQS